MSAMCATFCSENMPPSVQFATMERYLWLVPLCLRGDKNNHREWAMRRSEKPIGEERRWRYGEMAMKCPNCGTEILPEATSCSVCLHSLGSSDEQAPPFSQRPRGPLLAIGVVAAIAVAMLLTVALFLPWGDLNGRPNNQSSVGTLILTIVNPFHFGAGPCNYTLCLNGQQESNGTILAGESEIYEKNFSWSGSELTIHVHIEVLGGNTQPEDRTLTLTSGEVERLSIML